jgi:hypothetical protein
MYMGCKSFIIKTPSIISNVSEVSQLSVDTQLSVAVDFLNINPNIEPVRNLHNFFYFIPIFRSPIRRPLDHLLLRMWIPVISNKCVNALHKS